ncbi:MAG: hypothetical protein AAB649_02650 [Patescibacteria group bacterium]
MSNRDFELLINGTELFIIIGGFLGLMFWVIFRTDDWDQQDTKKSIQVVAMLAAIFIGLKGVSNLHHLKRASQFAEMVGYTPAKVRHWTIEPDEYKPGILWWGGAVAPGGFEHGTAWIVNFETEGHRIRTLALEDPKIVYVDVYDDGDLDAVYPAEVKKGSFPSILEKSRPRKPTESEREHYASLR